MSTRQLRLNKQDQILKKLQELSGKKVNIVLNNGTVVLVIVKDIKDQKLVALNMRLKIINIPLSDINEIYFDTKE